MKETLLTEVLMFAAWTMTMWYLRYQTPESEYENMQAMKSRDSTMTHWPDILFVVLSSLL